MDLRAQARKRALIATAISLVCFLAWNQFRTFKHPWGDLSSGNYTDHFSHMNAARAFPRVGLDIWRKPAVELTRPATPQEEAAWPADVHPGGKWTGGTYVMEGWPADKPWVTSWGKIPRLYPPGDMLLVAPVALAYHFSGLSLTEANRWLFALLLLYAHLGIFLILESLLLSTPRSSPLLYPLGLTTCVLMVVWSLQGFYDAAAIAPLLLCARYLQQRRGLAALVAFTVAAFIHFRSFFLAPWAVYAVWIFVRDGQWRGLRARDFFAAGAGGLCAFASLGVFALVSPVLAKQQINNSLNLTVPHAAALLAFAAVVAVATFLLSRARAWIDLAVLGWLTLMMFFVKEAHEWHIVIPLAWVVAPVESSRPGLVRTARMLVIAYLAVRVMVN
jgi:hypothetical protein